MNEHIEIDLEINDGQVDINLEVDTGVPDYLSMIVNDTLTELNPSNYHSDTVPASLFKNKHALKSVNLPQVVRIYEYAFEKCNNLKYVYAPALTNAGMYALSDTGIEEISLPVLENSLSGLFQYSEIRKASLESVKILGGFMSTPLEYCDAPKATRIDSNAFESCNHIIEIHAPEISIFPSSYSFRYSNITHSYFNNVESTYKNTNGSSNGAPYYQNSELLCISFPNLTGFGNITKYSDGRLSQGASFCIAFDCPKLTKAFFPKMEEASFGQYTFQYCPELHTISFPSLETMFVYSTGFISPARQTADVKNYDVDINLPSLTYLNMRNPTSSACRTINMVIGSEGDTDVCTCANTLFTSASYKPASLNIYVPDHLVNAYKTATNWSAVADSIKPQSDMPDDLIARIDESNTAPEYPGFEAGVLPELRQEATA